MDFSKLMAAASKNQKKAAKSVTSIDPNSSKLKFGYEKERTKTNEHSKTLSSKSAVHKSSASTSKSSSNSKSCPLNSKSTSSSLNSKITQAIPKIPLKNSKEKEKGPSKEAIAAVLARKKAEETKNQLLKKKDEREKSIRKAMKMVGGRLTKEVAKQFRMDPGEVIRYSITHTNHDHTPRNSVQAQKMHAPSIKQQNDSKDGKSNKNHNSTPKSSDSRHKSHVNGHKTVVDRNPRANNSGKNGIHDKIKAKPPPSMDFSQLMKMAANAKDNPNILESHERKMQEMNSRNAKLSHSKREPSPKPSLPPKAPKNPQEARFRAAIEARRLQSSKNDPVRMSKNARANCDPKYGASASLFAKSSQQRPLKNDRNLYPIPMKSNTSSQSTKKAAPPPVASNVSKKPPQNSHRPVEKRPKFDPHASARMNRPEPRSEHRRAPIPNKGISAPGYQSVVQAAIQRKRPIPVETYSDSEEYDSEMDDFIDDSEPVNINNRELAETLRTAFKYDKSRFAREEEFDDRTMESSFRDICSEEAKSLRVAKMEDLREWQIEQGLLKRDSNR